MRSIAIATLCVAFLGMLAPMALADGRNPGSTLVYPIHRSGGGFFTVVCVTNTNLNPVDGETNVHFEYVNVTANPANAFKPLSCSIFNRIENLTPADTLCVLTGCHNAAAAGGQEGYLVVSAQDPDLFNTAWSFNHLIGSELVINATGVMFSVNAIPFESPQPEGNPTDLNGDGELDFDGAEYEEIADQLYIDSFVALANSSLTLINLTGGEQDMNTLQFNVWNDDEFPLSTTLVFSCWFDQPLTAVAPLFSAAFLAGLPNAMGELDTDCDGMGDLEGGWARIDSIVVKTPGGTTVATDGAILGAITAGDAASINGGHLLWESVAKQNNGKFMAP